MVNEFLVNLVNSVLGPGKKTSRGNYAYHCVFCNHPKPKFEINFDTNEDGENPYRCWVCHTKGMTLQNLFKRVKASPDKIEELNKLTNYIPKKQHSSTLTESLKPSLPKEFTPLYPKSESFYAKKALNFLKSRGITEKDIIKYNLGYCNSGDYDGRIIIPSFDKDGNLNYFSSRSFMFNNEVKYKNPPISRDIIPFEFFINWDAPIILCEGPFDAMAIKRNAIPLFGTSISKTLYKKIYSSKVKKIYLALDKDALGKSITYCEELMKEGKQVYLIKLEDKDPNETDFDKILELLHNAKQLTLSDLMRYKLNI